MRPLFAGLSILRNIPIDITHHAIFYNCHHCDFITCYPFADECSCRVAPSHCSLFPFQCIVTAPSNVLLKFTNNCGHGTPLFLYQGNGNPQGATTIQGELNGGIAWLGNQGNCESSGVNCGAVEFTLQNTGYSQADFTLETGSGLGNHQ